MTVTTIRAAARNQYEQNSSPVVKCALHLDATGQPPALGGDPVMTQGLDCTPDPYANEQ